MIPSTTILEDCVACLSQGIQLIQQLPVHYYSYPYHNDTIGKHVLQILQACHLFNTGKKSLDNSPETQCRMQVIETSPANAIGCLRKHIALLITLEPAFASENGEENEDFPMPSDEEAQKLLATIQDHFKHIEALCKQFGIRVVRDFGHPKAQQQQQCAQ